MSTELAASTEFQQRMFEKIRENIGNLLTDAELKKIIETAMQKAFFEERIDNERSDNWRSYKKPALMVESIEKLLKERVDAAITQWISEHKDEVEKIVSEIVGKGVAGLLQIYIMNIMAPGWTALQNSLRDKGIIINA
jgi:hypothetical protein